MKTTSLIIGVAALLLAGCATPFRAPADVAHIALERGDSPVVVVEKIWLERKQGPLVVKGYVLKHLGVTDTTQTHLDVTLFDANGQVLKTSVEHFEPRQIPQRFRRQPIASYSVVLDPLPAGVTKIRVAAHEGEHR